GDHERPSGPGPISLPGRPPGSDGPARDIPARRGGLLRIRELALEGRFDHQALRCEPRANPRFPNARLLRHGRILRGPSPRAAGSRGLCDKSSHSYSRPLCGGVGSSVPLVKLLAIAARSLEEPTAMPPQFFNVREVLGRLDP